MRKLYEYIITIINNLNLHYADDRNYNSPELQIKMAELAGGKGIIGDKGATLYRATGDDRLPVVYGVTAGNNMCFESTSFMHDDTAFVVTVIPEKDYIKDVLCGDDEGNIDSNAILNFVSDLYAFLTSLFTAISGNTDSEYGIIGSEYQYMKTEVFIRREVLRFILISFGEERERAVESIWKSGCRLYGEQNAIEMASKILYDFGGEPETEQFLKNGFIDYYLPYTAMIDSEDE